MGDKNTLVLVKLWDGMWASENPEKEGLSVRIGYVDKNVGYRVHARIQTNIGYEESEEFFPSFVTAVDDLRKYLTKRNITLKIV